MLKHFPALTQDNRYAPCRPIDLRIAHYANSKKTEKLLLDLITLYEKTNDEGLLLKKIESALQIHSLRCKLCASTQSCYTFAEIQGISEILFL
jgi:hypothetical protein